MENPIFCHFQQLSKREQTTTTWEQGVFVAMRKSENLMVLLYQLDTFYVEMYYNHPLVKIEKVRCFSCTDELEPYLSAIDLSDLL